MSAGGTTAEGHPGRAAGQLTGVGVGPGDPELITLKAVHVLQRADVVFVPVAAGAEGADGLQRGYAEQVVLAHVDEAKVQRLGFALGDDPAQRERSWDAAGAAVAAAVRAGDRAAFATIGDPNLYSTFTYLAQTVRTLVPEVVVQTVPGITALQALAARTGTILAEGTRTLALLPLTAGLERVGAALQTHDTVVLYKGGRCVPEIRTLLEAAGRLDQAVFGARLGLDGEIVGQLPTGPAPYLSTVIVTRPSDERGAAL